MTPRGEMTRKVRGKRHSSVTTDRTFSNKSPSEGRVTRNLRARDQEPVNTRTPTADSEARRRGIPDHAGPA